MSNPNNSVSRVDLQPLVRLLPCPFCGQAATIEHSELEIECGIKAHAECSNQKCRALLIRLANTFIFYNEA